MLCLCTRYRSFEQAYGLISLQLALFDAGCERRNNYSIIDNQSFMPRRAEMVIVETEVNKVVEQWILKQ